MTVSTTHCSWTLSTSFRRSTVRRPVRIRWSMWLRRQYRKSLSNFRGSCLRQISSSPLRLLPLTPNNNCKWVQCSSIGKTNWKSFQIWRLVKGIKCRIFRKMMPKAALKIIYLTDIKTILTTTQTMTSCQFQSIKNMSSFKIKNKMRETWHVTWIVCGLRQTRP